MRKNNVRKTKTDKVDTFVIAKTLMMQDSLPFMALEGSGLHWSSKISVDSARNL